MKAWTIGAGIRLATVAMAGIALFGGCADRLATPPAGSREAGTIRRGEFQPRVLLTGELRALRAMPLLVPRVRSWQVPIRRLEQDGAAVHEGQVVVELDSTQFSGDLEQKRLAESGAANQLLQKEAEIAGQISDKEFAVEQRRIQLEKAELEAEIPESLRARREYQEAQLALETARVEHAKAVEELQAARRASDAEIEVLRVDLRKAQEEIRVAEQAIDALSLRAPRDGILVIAENPREDRKWQVGDNAWVGATVARVPDLSAMTVEAWLSDVDDGLVQPGMRARCALDTYPDRVLTGRVTSMSPVAQEAESDSLRRNFRVIVALDEAHPEWMLPGMSVRVEVLPPPLDNVLLAPRGAIDLAGAPPRVRLASGTAVEVELGPCGPQNCVIRGDLEPGVRVATSGSAG